MEAISAQPPKVTTQTENVAFRAMQFDNADQICRILIP
jgi:hypothetical protein